MRKSIFKTGMMLRPRLHIVAFAFLMVFGCTSLPPEEQGPTKIELNQMGEKAISTLLETKPQLQEELDKSPGYAVVDMAITKIPVIGTGAGFGVVVNKRNNTRSYIKVSQFEFGGGMGAEKFKVIIVFDDEKLVDKAAAGTWHYEAGAEAVAGSDSAGAATSKADKGYKAFKLTEGVCVRVTVRVARATPYLANQ